MEDDKGLELSLGLACGGSSSNSKDKNGNSTNCKTEPIDSDERTNKVINEFKNFLRARVPQSFPINDAQKPKESFFSNLQPIDIDRKNASNEDHEVDENKRKLSFDELNNHKKPNTNTWDSDLQEKGKTSHISITTDEGSTAENDDVVESETEGSTSRLAYPIEDGSRTPCGSDSSSQAPKGNIPYSITVKESRLGSPLTSLSYPLSGLMSGIASTNGVHARAQTCAPSSLPMSFGFSHGQLPVLDNKESTLRMGGHSQALLSPYAGRSISNSGLDVHPLENTKGQTQPLAEEGSSSQIEDDTKGRATNFPLEFPAIRPGIAPDVKFGGSGSFPNLPWVSTRSPGPNGRTISGVTYKYNATQIKIVCACHGTHMSPDEFIHHAMEEEQSSVTAPNVSSLESMNPTSSTT